MNKTLLTIAIAVLGTLAVHAQNNGDAMDPQVLQDLRENIFRTGVNTNPYEYIPSAETAVPRGFKSFYISHYGRHGSRSNWSGTAYPYTQEKFTLAQRAGLLTQDGLASLERINEIIRLHDGMNGRLTRRGQREHRQIAGRMYEKYRRTVFADKRRRTVHAGSSMTQRCIISMNAFTGELLSRAPGLDIWWDTGETIQPIYSTNDPDDVNKEAHKIINADRAAHLPDTAAFMARMFTDPAAARAVIGDPLELLEGYIYMACICGSWDLDDFMLRCLSEEDRYRYAENIGLNLYLRQCNSIEFGDRRMEPEDPLLDDFIGRADEAIAGNDVCADLRFGHDYQLLAFCSRIGIRGVAERRTAGDLRGWRSYLYTPFAGNLQTVFYRNKAGEVLVKFYLNEREATTMLLPGGPYYRWEDFKKAVRYRPVMGEVEATVQTSCQEISGLCPNPAGEGWLAASDENGIWSISPTGETKPFWTVSTGWLDCEGVTADPATGDVYYVVEGKQELCRLAAPAYDKTETLLTLKDIAFDTNHGLEGVTWFRDGTLLLGNQYKPVQLIHFSPRDGILSRKDLLNTSEIADLFYDESTGFLWIADSYKFRLYLCNTDGEVILSYPIPFVANGEGLCVDRSGSCIWIGDDETSKLYKIHFDNL